VFTVDRCGRRIGLGMTWRSIAPTVLAFDWWGESSKFSRSESSNGSASVFSASAAWTQARRLFRRLLGSKDSSCSWPSASCQSKRCFLYHWWSRAELAASATEGTHLPRGLSATREIAAILSTRSSPSTYRQPGASQGLLKKKRTDPWCVVAVLPTCHATYFSKKLSRLDPRADQIFPRRRHAVTQFLSREFLGRPSISCLHTPVKATAQRRPGRVPKGWHLKVLYTCWLELAWQPRGGALWRAVKSDRVYAGPVKTTSLAVRFSTRPRVTATSPIPGTTFDGDRLAVGRLAPRNFGCGELSRTNVANRIHPEDLVGRQLAARLSSFDDEAAFDCEYRLRDAAGGLVWCTSAAHATRDRVRSAAIHMLPSHPRDRLIASYQPTGRAAGDFDDERVFQTRAAAAKAVDQIIAAIAHRQPWRGFLSSASTNMKMIKSMCRAGHDAADMSVLIEMGLRLDSSSRFCDPIGGSASNRFRPVLRIFRSSIAAPAEKILAAASRCR